MSYFCPNLTIMKKLLTLTFATALIAASCSKKDSTYKQDSNTMLAEPEVSEMDTTQTISEPTATSTFEGTGPNASGDTIKPYPAGTTSTGATDKSKPSGNE